MTWTLFALFLLLAIGFGVAYAYMQSTHAPFHPGVDELAAEAEGERTDHARAA